LEAYSKWGVGCPKKLIGDYAFAIWDKRNLQLFCARDHIGIRPFYYYYSDNIFALASEIKAIFCLVEVPQRLNELKIAYHLATFFEDKAITYYKDIFRLPPAHYLIIRKKRLMLKSYWSLDPSRSIKCSSDKEYAERFKDLFTKTVRCRLRSAFPVGSTLSGGLDSSSIACVSRNLMAKNKQLHLHTYSAIFPSLPKEDLRKIDERKYMDRVLTTGGFLPHFVRADRLSPLTDLDQIMWVADEAILAPNIYIHQAIYQDAHGHGVRILLDGIDGDTTVSHGLEYFAEMASRLHWKTLISEAKAFAAKRNISSRKVIWRYAIRPCVPPFVAELWRRVKHNNNNSFKNDFLINPSFSCKVGLEQSLKGERAKIAFLNDAKKVHLCSLNSGLNAHGMQQLDITAARFCLEPRYPFFDRRMMEFCLAVPPSQKLKFGWERFIFRRSMEDILPREIQWRLLKANLSPNFTRRLFKCEKKVLDDVVLSNSNLLSPYVNMSNLQQIYDRYIANPIGCPREAVSLYSVITLAEFLRWFNTSSLH
jgi:asparagine synthase (glutamine-hydrolysing)